MSNYFNEERTRKIVNDILNRHGHIFDALAWREQPKGTPMPESLKTYLSKMLGLK